jgi:arginase
MGVAHLLDADGCLEDLSALGPRRPMLSGTDVLLFAQDNITDSEAAIVAAKRVTVETLDEVHRDPGVAARRAIDWASGHDELWVHVDADVLSWIDFPIAENSRRRDGLTLVELASVLQTLVAAPNWRGLTMCEVNPDHAPDEAESFERLVETMGEIFTARGSGPSAQGA